MPTTIRGAQVATVATYIVEEKSPRLLRVFTAGRVFAVGLLAILEVANAYRFAGIANKRILKRGGTHIDKKL